MLMGSVFINVSILVYFYHECMKDNPSVMIRFHQKKFKRLVTNINTVEKNTYFCHFKSIKYDGWFICLYDIIYLNIVGE
jgi:hypothetical protein